MIKEVLGIQHRVSSIQHQPVKCTHLSIPTMPAEKILCDVRVNTCKRLSQRAPSRRLFPKIKKEAKEHRNGLTPESMEIRGIRGVVCPELLQPRIGPQEEFLGPDRGCGGKAGEDMRGGW